MPIVLFLLAATFASPDVAFEAVFTGRTLRFDYYHSGTATEEHISPDGLRQEGPWPGSRTALQDDTNLGKYLFAVVDLATQQTLWSRGFASIFGEWETTGEAQQLWRTFQESQRFPEPRAPVQLIVRKRAADGSFREIFAQVVDPQSRFVDRSPVLPRGTAKTLFAHAPAEKAVDLLVMGDGYTAEQEGKFWDDARRLTGVLFQTEPFRTHRESFNVRALHLPAAEPGISNPRKDVWKNSPLGTSFNAFDSDRYVLTFSNQALREVASQLPYDALIILANERKYGGGGIFNLWAICTADTEPAPYVFVHEFGHAFAGLADEYYSSQVAYASFNPPGSEPWEPNVTALLSPPDLKWKELVDSETPIPTPWDQEAYDRAELAHQARRAELLERQAPEEEMEAYFRDVKTASSARLAGERYFGRTGAFQGAAYQARGLYRPEVDCLMFSRNLTSFCRVCTQAIERVIQLHCR